MKNNVSKNAAYNPENCAEEFDLDNIWLKLNSQSTSCNVRADMFFVEATGELLQAQATVKRLCSQEEKKERFVR